MKYLKAYQIFESDNLSDVKNNCNDILLPLSDNNIRYIINESIKSVIIIEIGSERSPDLIKIKDIESEILHLISYLNDEGFSLKSDSYFINVDEYCPNCRSKRIKFVYRDDPDNLKCNSCKFKGGKHYFINYNSYPLTMDKLKHLIEGDESINYMELIFIKK